MYSENRYFSAIISDIEQCLDSIAVRLNGPVVVGLSGGKDSTTLMIALRHLGVEVHPAIVDIGYRHFDSISVADTARGLGFNPRILSLTLTESVSFIHGSELIDEKKNQSLLLSDCLQTPCALCSRTKRSILYSYATHIGSQWVALAHHMDDFIVTFLKDYWANLYYSQIGTYDVERFTGFISIREIDLAYLRGLLLNHEASTMAIRLNENKGSNIIRPLAFVPESRIINFTKSGGIKTHGSGCAHDIFYDSQSAVPTKREIIHADYHRRLQDNPQLSLILSEIAFQSLAPDGGLAFVNPRSQRQKSMPNFCPENGRN